MAGESCNLDKEEAELLRPPSPSSPSSPSSPALPPNAAAASPLPLFPKSPTQRTPETPPADPGADAAVACGGEERLEEEDPPPGRSTIRCSSCGRRVGLTGFRCRCGVLFCARHRHADAHDCSFDYKAVGREEISRANPLIRAAKIIKI